MSNKVHVLMDFRQGPDNVEGSQAIDAAEAVESNLRSLRRLTGPDRYR
ncbi:unnamed protein product [Fusarium venenatum]|uniref:Uncharacterized protein n=1 Tax=Fusarium venenatum TaxID=56646 RepID=A0A2L2TXM1_9HYPO|nr:uncharacterized protein FVRRES_03192 [Fusarium venenatum]CEI66680.1 unnamed protein product [Fusarium venenatum]